MKVLKIEIVLAKSDVGTIAKVLTKSFFKTKETEYICHKASPLMGAEWVDAQSGLMAGSDIATQINDAAQAAASLAKLQGNLSRTL